MKDLLDRYLAAVARGLPDRQRADIVAELRDELLTKVEISEAAAGRPLERDELEALLVEFGHPLIIAGRYRKVQHLIGPEIYPMWWYALKITLAITAAVYLVAAIMKAAFVTDGTVANVDLPGLVPALLTAFGAVTAVAVVIERLNLQRFVYQWRPRQLPPATAKSKSPFERVVEIGMQGVFILWWTGVIHFRDWIPMGALSVELAPVFQAWFWPILGYSVFEMTMNVIGLVRPGWTRLNAALRLTRTLAGLAIAAGLLEAGHWVTVTSGEMLADMDIVQMNFDLGVKIGLVVTVACFAIMAVVDAWRLWRATQDAKTPLSVSAA
jgi:hypothetical protein